MMKKEWRPIPNWSEFYEVSNQGEVRSKNRRVLSLHPCGRKLYRSFKGKILKPSSTPKGYKSVSLIRPGKKRFCTYVHTLVALAFLGPRPFNYEICHYDGCPSNNNLSNLRYGTKSENRLDAKRHGTLVTLCGLKSPSAKLSKKQIKWIFKNSKTFSKRELGRKCGVSHSQIIALLNGKTYKEVSRGLIK